MADRLVLHIGAMKSGTSFLQNVMAANAELLEASSVKLAGRKWTHQVFAVHQLIDYGGLRQRPMPADGHYARLVDDVHRFPGTSVFSMEFLGPRNKGKIRQLLSSFPDTQVDVVMTARDLA